MTDPSPPLSAQILALPFPVRLSLWMAYGTALGIPVDSVFAMINVLMVAAKRQLAGDACV